MKLLEDVLGTIGWIAVWLILSGIPIVAAAVAVGWIVGVTLRYVQ